MKGQVDREMLYSFFCFFEHFSNFCNITGRPGGLLFQADPNRAGSAANDKKLKESD